MEGGREGGREGGMEKPCIHVYCVLLVYNQLV